MKALTFLRDASDFIGWLVIGWQVVLLVGVGKDISVRWSAFSSSAHDAHAVIASTHEHTLTHLCA